MNQRQADAERKLLEHLSAAELKNIGESIADVIRQHDLHHSPDVCRELFSYLADVIEAWNSV